MLYQKLPTVCQEKSVSTYCNDVKANKSSPRHILIFFLVNICSGPPIEYNEKVKLRHSLKEN